jgi:catechol 2,3-dioxygenase-like lactoylglutathione lyase family enzyme
MKFGDTASITVSAPDLQASLSFYQKLGFRKSEGARRMRAQPLSLTVS